MCHKTKPNQLPVGKITLDVASVEAPKGTWRSCLTGIELFAWFLGAFLPGTTFLPGLILFLSVRGIPKRE